MQAYRKESGTRPTSKVAASKDSFEATAKCVEGDEDRARFEAKLGKMAKVKKPETGVRQEQFAAIYSVLRAIAEPYAESLSVKADKLDEYVLSGKRPSPFPQHKGKPLDFIYVRASKAYVSFHLLPLSGTKAAISPELKKHMHGKTCFNFKAAPSSKLRSELDRLTEQGFRQWLMLGWL